MKKNVFAFLFGMLAMSAVYASEPNEKQEEKQDPKVVLLKQSDNVDQFTDNESLTLEFVYGLNFAGKKKIKEMAIEKFKEMAGEKGYTHLMINEDDSYKKQYEIRKRNYTVLLVGKAYK